MYQKRIVYSVFLICIGLLSAACSRPKEVLNKKEMEELMYDIYIAEALIESDYQNFDTPQKKEALISEVFRKHKTTQAQWDTSLSWYSDKIDIYLKVNDSVKSQLKRRQTALNKAIATQNNSLQAITEQLHDKSYIPSIYGFDTYYPYNGFKFSLDSAAIARKITEASFHFQFRVTGIPANKKPALKSFLALEYSDTTIYRTANITDNLSYTLQGTKYLAGDTLKSITGYVKLQDTTGYFKQIKLYDILLGDPFRKRATTADKQPQ